jgi:cell division protein FtsL
MPIKKILFFGVLIGSLIIINNLVRSTYTLLQKHNLVVQAQQELDKQKHENRDLKNKIAEVKTPQFIEEEARNKLFLSKPGEGIIVIPTGALQASPSAAPKPRDTRQNWEKWVDLFK